MHTYEDIETGIVFHYNLDMSGMVEIVVPLEAEGEGTQIRIPSEALSRFFSLVYLNSDEILEWIDNLRAWITKHDNTAQAFCDQKTVNPKKPLILVFPQHVFYQFQSWFKLAIAQADISALKIKCDAHPLNDEIVYEVLEARIDPDGIENSIELEESDLDIFEVYTNVTLVELRSSDSVRAEFKYETVDDLKKTSSIDDKPLNSAKLVNSLTYEVGDRVILTVVPFQGETGEIISVSSEGCGDFVYIKLDSHGGHIGPLYLKDFKKISREKLSK